MLFALSPRSEMDHSDLDEPADPSSARKRPRGILTRTPQAPPSSVIQSRAVRFIEENNQSYPASPFAQTSRSMAALAATPSKGKAPLDLAAGDLVHYSADNMMSPTSAGSPMTPAGSRLLEEADQDLRGSPSMGLKTPSAQRGETFQVVLGTPGGLSAQQVWTLCHLHALLNRLGYETPTLSRIPRIPVSSQCVRDLNPRLMR